MTKEEITKELAIVEPEVEKAKAQLYRLEGIAMYLRGKLLELEKPKVTQEVQPVVE